MNSDPIHRAQFRQLWIDKVRDQLDDTFSPLEFERTIKVETLNRLLDSTTSRERIRSLPPAQFAAELVKHDLAVPPPIFALKALEARGYPQRELTIQDDWLACEARVCGCLNWSCFDILRSPETQIMLLDDRTAKAVVDSTNDQITAAELQHLPHNPCLIEFYRPIEIAETVKRGVRLRAVGFEAVGNAEVPAAVVGFYLDYWQSVPETRTRWPATIGIWFGGFNVVTVDEAARTQIGFESGSLVEAGISEACKRVGRNLWDFVTMRSINYNRIRRKPAKRPLDRIPPQHTQGLHSNLAREVFHLYLTHDAERAESSDSRSSAPQWGYRIKIPGKFHHSVYCARCGDLHRHDLLGQPCRKCGETVGPRANVRVEKFWHHPYLMGPEGAPVKEVVRDVHRVKPRR